MHFQCFYKFIFNSFDTEFECPFCKKLFNIIFFDFSDIIKNNYEIIEGFNYINEKMDFDEFYKINKGDELQGLFFSNIKTFKIISQNYLERKF